MSSNHSDATPSKWLVQHINLIKPGGEILDVAAGSGRNARWLAQQGFKVEAVDRDATALATLNNVPDLVTNVADLENADWPYDGRMFDAIVVCRYLFRPLLPLLTKSLAPQGVFIYETFMQGHEIYGRPQNPDYLLRSNELLEACMPDLTVIRFEQGKLVDTPPAVIQRICAIRLYVQ